MLDFIKSRWPLFAGLGGIFLLSILSGVSMCIYKESNREKTIREWDYGKYSVGKCVLGAPKVYVENCLASEPGKPCKSDAAWQKVLDDAVEIWRMKFKKPFRDFLSTKEFTNGSVRLQIFRYDRRAGNLGVICAPSLWNADRLIQNRRFAVSVFNHSPSYRDSYIVVCGNKLESSYSRLNSQTATWLRSLGKSGIVAHEIGHFLVGPSHPDPYAVLMSSEPENTHITQTTLRIVENGISSCRSLP